MSDAEHPHRLPVGIGRGLATPREAAPFLLLAASAVIAPLLAAWGEGGGPRSGLALYLMAAYVLWPTAILGPALSALSLAADRGARRATLVAVAVGWLAATILVVVLALYAGFAIGCGGTCLS